MRPAGQNNTPQALWRARFRQIGNAAGVGAKQMLISTEHREIASQLVGGIEYLELTTYSGFSEILLKSMYF